MAKDDPIKKKPSSEPWEPKQFHSDPKLNELLNKLAEAVHRRTLCELESQRIVKEHKERMKLAGILNEYNRRTGEGLRLTNFNEMIGSKYMNWPRLSAN